MSKILRAKKWLTLDDAANRISISMEDEVRPVDLLQFALDGQLTLSVNFVNDAIGYEVIEQEPSEILLAAIRSFASFFKDNPPPVGSERVSPLSKWHKQWVKNTTGLDDYQIAKSIKSLHRTGDLLHIAGIWDLPMIGAEILAVQDAMLEMMGGPSIEMVNIDGCFVGNREGRIVQLHAKFSDFEETKDIDETFPRSDFPPGAMLVMRPESISDFEASLTDDEPEIHKPSDSSTERTNLLKMIGGFGLLIAERGGKYKCGNKPNAKAIADAVSEIIEAIPGASTYGLTSENIRKKLSNAIRLLNKA